MLRLGLELQRDRRTDSYFSGAGSDAVPEKFPQHTQRGFAPAGQDGFQSHIHDCALVEKVPFENLWVDW